MERRKFLVKAGGVLVGAGAATAVNAPNVIAKPKYTWRLSTSFGKRGLGPRGLEMFSKTVESATDGRLKIELFAAGELMPAFANFEAASQGTIEAGYGAAYYWAAREPATQWFSAVPFGLNAQGTQAWITAGGGQQLYDELYEAFNLIPRRFGATGVQMGGWFNKKIESINDYKGLKMRIPGLGGKVVEKAGASVVLLPGGDIVPSLKRGAIDAAEFVGPFVDLILGFYQAAKYYYYPGWHEPGGSGDLFFNKKARESLPVEFQPIIDGAAEKAATWVFTSYEAKNAAALDELMTKHHVQLFQFPDSVLAAFRRLSEEVVREEAEKTPMTKKVFESYQKFQKQWLGWSNISERAYYNMMFV